MEFKKIIGKKSNNEDIQAIKNLLVEKKVFTEKEFKDKKEALKNGK